MMFRRSLIDLVFPDDDEAFRLHMDFYIVVMAQMVAGSLLIDEALYSYRLHGRNGAAIAGLMDTFKQGGGFSVEQERWTEARKLFDSLAVDDAQTCETIAEVYEQTGEVLDPHTAIGVKAARECRRSLDIPMVILGTAHPVKFPDAVEKAGVGKALELPAHLSDLFEREERCTVLANELKAVQAFVSQHGNRGKPL